MEKGKAGRPAPAGAGGLSAGPVRAGAAALPDSAHPMIKPALRRAWRNRDSVQFGAAPAHAVVVGPLDTATSCFLGLLDGTRGMPLLREEARRIGLPEGRADAVVERLAGAGLLDDPRGGGEGAAALRGRGGDGLARLRPDLGSLSVLHAEPGAPMRLMAARQSMRVQVRGAGRVGATVAALLSASGVGRVDVLDGGCVEPWDVAPGGVRTGRSGERRDATVRQVVREAAPVPPPRARAGGGDRGSDAVPRLALVILAPRDGLAAYAPDVAASEELLLSGTPHLYAGVLEATGVVGPLVLPGGTACAGCVELARAERDPAWPRMLAQWRSGRAAGVPSCDMALATVVAGLTVARALAFLDGGSTSGAGVRLELALPGPAWTPRPVEPHPRCPCGAAGSPHPGMPESHGHRTGQ
ncbi:hypothetical protein BLA24_25080 [Streptomyces cinnamoneus]|uniref:THIF-type NAD/FAD binding fold domain-containing protein n=2 Tax=Streptomyces cinnamoneus TaxID=53446 RepID=A0A2G1XER8_STRCJ|nr:hypothetical protein BLA24_25080 [Streptomyces cinnamoneus]PPT16697.1 hypothetical protein CYQ11_20990 [Streptomyces cinnamoneus]